MNILLSSVGRRPYLVRWFKEALLLNGVDGQVVAADSDPLAPARSFADAFMPAPRVDDPRYEQWLGDSLREMHVDLAVSVNDFELARWSELSSEDSWSCLVRLPAATQRVVDDKVLMNRTLQLAGIGSPATHTGRFPEMIIRQSKTGRFITKGRFGSASRGLNFTNADELADTILAASDQVTNRYGVHAHLQSEFTPADLVIVQEEVKGTEFGLDVISDLNGEFVSVLARRKIAMRGGETDRAESVDGSAFRALARRIARELPHRGSMDIDVIVDADGNSYVIDVNPRFGGGYPFSHLAGAHVPAAYVAWAHGRQPSDEWLVATPGVVSGKYVEAVVVQ
ncbi:MAG: ATP-grasp domain-containing protein [Micropruina sp.]|nr:ATP-grasp domain-containing protein [Micropruina sp.]